MRRINLPSSVVSKIEEVAQSAFVQRLAIYGSVSTFAQGLMVLYALLLARVLGPEAYGLYAGTYALAGLSSFFINWGMDTWLLRQPGSEFSLFSLSGSILRAKAGLGLIWGAALVLFVLLLRKDIFSPVLMFVCVLDVWSDSCFNTQVAALNVQQRVRPISRLMILSRGGRFLAALAVIGLNQASPLNFAITRGLFSVISLVAVTLVFKPLLFCRPALSERKILRRSLSYGISEFLAVIYAQADVTLLTLFGNQAATGLYSAAVGMVNALFVVPNAAYFVAVPTFARLLVTINRRSLESYRKLMTLFVLIGAGLTLLVCFPISRLTQFLLGPNYTVTATLLMILSPVLFLKSLEFGWASILVAINWQSRRLVPQVLSAGANILINLVVIPFFGIKGVALVYVLSEFILAIGYYRLVSLYFRQKGSVNE